MISEKMLAQKSPSIWRLLTPTMDIFIRKINLELYERDFPPIAADTAPNRRGLINELAFSLFSNCQATNTSSLGPEINRKSIVESIEVISRMERVPTELISLPTSAEFDDARKQFERLCKFFEIYHPAKSIETRPTFIGCGIVDACIGDAYCDNTLYEVKAGDRSFRSTDLRQLLIYSALNWQAQTRPLLNLGLINPRMGTSYRSGVDEISIEISGRPAVELWSEIIRMVSSGDVSR